MAANIDTLCKTLAQTLNASLSARPYDKPFTATSLRDLLNAAPRSGGAALGTPEAVRLLDTVLFEALGVTSAHTELTTLKAIHERAVSEGIVDIAVVPNLDNGVNRALFLHDVLGELCALRVAVVRQSSTATVPMVDGLLSQLVHTFPTLEPAGLTTAKPLFSALEGEVKRLVEATPASDLKPVGLAAADADVATIQSYAVDIAAHYTHCRRAMRTRFYVLMKAMSEADLLTAYQRLVCEHRIEERNRLFDVDVDPKVDAARALDVVRSLSPVPITAMQELSGRRGTVQHKLLGYKHRDIRIGAVPDRGGRTNVYNMEEKVITDIRRADHDMTRRSGGGGRGGGGGGFQRQGSSSYGAAAPAAPPPSYNSKPFAQPQGPGGDFQRYEAFAQGQTHGEATKQTSGGGGRGGGGRGRGGGNRNY